MARWSLLTGHALIVDLTKAESIDGASDESGWLRPFLAAIAFLGAPAALISGDEARGVRLIGSTTFDLIADNALPIATRSKPFAPRRKARMYGSAEEQARVVASRYPLHVDGLEHAMASRAQPAEELRRRTTRELARFTAACKEVAPKVSRISPIASSRSSTSTTSCCRPIGRSS